MMNQASSPHTADGAAPANVVPRIQAALDGLRFGSVVVTIRDSKVVQIERTEKVHIRKKTEGEIQ
jgi:hypothetical protein